MNTLKERALRRVSSDEAVGRFGSLVFFAGSVALPLLFGWKLTAVAPSPGELLAALLLVLNTSLLCLLIGLVLPLYVQR